MVYLTTTLDVKCSKCECIIKEEDVFRYKTQVVCWNCLINGDN